MIYVFPWSITYALCLNYQIKKEEEEEENNKKCEQFFNQLKDVMSARVKNKLK